VVKRDFGRLLLKLEELQDEAVRKTLEPKDETVTLSDEEQQAALELLRDPKLLPRILTDYERCGVVGEETNKLVCYLAAVSRKLDEPLAIIIQSSSAAGLKLTLLSRHNGRERKSPRQPRRRCGNSRTLHSTRNVVIQMKSIIVLASLLTVMSLAFTQDAPGWRGIVPLHSTRAQLEQLVGVLDIQCQLN